MALQAMDPKDVRRGLRRWGKARNGRRRMAKARRFNLYAAPLATALVVLVGLLLR